MSMREVLRVERTCLPAAASASSCSSSRNLPPTLPPSAMTSAIKTRPLSASLRPSLIRNPSSFTRRIRPLSAAFSLSVMSSTPAAPTPKVMPECWGHRGASSRFPENTLASFEAAIRDGAEGIESDVHVSVDDVVIMFHDPSVDRVTDGTGLIRERLWYGEGGMHTLRTVKEPKQSLTTFEETINLLMKPENRHVKFNVDVKVQNKPAHLFALMHKTISAQPDWETALAPRILLGLWHPSFLPHAKTHLPYCRRSYIGQSIATARKYFWDSCDVFSIKFSTLAMADGAKFRKDCKEAGKKVMAWTVNDPEHMVEAVRWGIDVIITDTTKTWLDLRSALQVDYDKIAAQHSRMFYWTTLEFYTPMQMLLRHRDHTYLEGYAGPFRKFDTVEPLALVS